MSRTLIFDGRGTGAYNQFCLIPEFQRLLTYTMPTKEVLVLVIRVGEISISYKVLPSI
jgi:hypothetical protein